MNALKCFIRRTRLHKHIDNLLRDFGGCDNLVISKEAFDILWWRKIDWVLHGLLPLLGAILLLLARVEIEETLVERVVKLSQREGLAKLVLLRRDEERPPVRLGQLCDLVGTESRDGTSVGRDRLGAHDHHVGLLDSIAHGAQRYRGDRYALGPERCDNPVALNLERRVYGVDDLESNRLVHVVSVVMLLCRAAQQRADDAAPTVRQDRRVVVYVLPGIDGDPLPPVLGPGGEYSAVPEQMQADLLETALRVGRVLVLDRSPGRIRLLKRHDQVLLEQVGAVGQGDGVRDGLLQLGTLRLDEIYSLEDGLDLAVAEEFDQGLDGRHGHGNVRVLGEEAVVSRDDAVGEEEKHEVSFAMRCRVLD